MTTTFKLANPDLLEAELTIRASVGDLKALRAQLKKAGSDYHHWPLRTFTRQVEELIEAAEKTFESSAIPAPAPASTITLTSDDEIPF